jgi:hypothetical protein
MFFWIHDQYIVTELFSGPSTFFPAHLIGIGNGVFFFAISTIRRDPSVAARRNL